MVIAGAGTRVRDDTAVGTRTAVGDAPVVFVRPGTKPLESDLHVLGSPVSTSVLPPIRKH